MADALVRAFEAAFGASPDGVWSAPGRVNLIGEHTDYNGGLALPFGIDRRTRVALRARDDDRIRLRSDLDVAYVESSLGSLDEATGWSRYVLGAVHVLTRETGHPGRGFDALVTSDVPIGVGVSSSAALESAVIVALDEVWGLGLDRAAMIRLGQLVENEVVGAPTGTLDKSAVLLARRDHAVLLDFAAGSAEQVPLGFETAGLEMLVVDSLVRHDHATGGYGERRRECEEAARIAGVATLREIAPADVEAWADRMPAHVHRRMRHVVTDTARAAAVAELVRAGRPRDIGPILTEGHVSQRDDFEDSVPAIDVAVEAALAAGALGARLTGGGFGGASIALVERDGSERIAAEVADRVEAAGHARPDVFAVRASDGARRDAQGVSDKPPRHRGLRGAASAGRCRRAGSHRRDGVGPLDDRSRGAWCAVTGMCSAERHRSAGPAAPLTPRAATAVLGRSRRRNARAPTGMPNRPRSVSARDRSARQSNCDPPP